MNKHVKVAKLKKEGVASLKKKIFIARPYVAAFQPAVSYAAETKSTEELTVWLQNLQRMKRKSPLANRKSQLESQLQIIRKN